MMTTETALCAGAPWLIRNTQNMFSFRTVLCDSPWAKFYVATLIQPDPECLISRSGYLCRRKVARGGGRGWDRESGCAGGKLVLARDALLYLSQMSAAHAN